MQVLASQLPFLANRNAELAVPPLFWPDTCIKIGGHVALQSGPTVYTLYCVPTMFIEAFLKMLISSFGNVEDSFDQFRILLSEVH